MLIKQDPPRLCVHAHVRMGVHFRLSSEVGEKGEDLFAFEVVACAFFATIASIANTSCSCATINTAASGTPLQAPPLPNVLINLQGGEKERRVCAMYAEGGFGQWRFDMCYLLPSPVH